MDWYTVWDYLNYLIIFMFLLFIPWVVLISRRQQGVSKSVMDLSHESIDIARQSIEISAAQLKEQHKTNELLKELIESLKK